MFLQVGAAAWAASGQLVIEASKFPQRGPGGFSYLKRIMIYSDYSQIDSAAGDATDPIELHDLIAEVTLEGAGEYFGPKGLSGHDLSAVYRAVSGRSIGYGVTDEGDANVAAGSDVDRQILEVFPFDLMGENAADFMPPCAFLARIGARLTIRFSALVGDAIVGNIRVYVETVEVPELRAVPPVVVERQGVSQLIQHTLGGGRMLFALLKRNADLTEALITSWQLRADGQLLIQTEDQGLFNALATLPDVNQEDAAVQDVQETGFGAAGGTRPRFLQMFPPYPYWMDRKVSNKPTANVFQASLGPGTLTASEYVYVTGTAKRLNIGRTIDQLAACGCDRGSIEDAVSRDPAGTLKPKVASKVGGVRPDLWGFLPVKLMDEKIAKGAGL